MSLTKQDLKAIGKLIEVSATRMVARVDDTESKMIARIDDTESKMIARIDDTESKMIARIDDLDDVLSIQTENGLQEVRDQVGAVKEVVDRIDRVQQAELERNDRQDCDIKQIRKCLHAA